MSTTEQAPPEPVRDRVSDRVMLAVVAQRLLGRQDGVAAKIGRFVVLDEIGAGGMGQVFRAYDPQLDRRIALKVLRPQASTRDDRAGARLHAEAMALAQLSHPNVVTIFEVGAADGEIFLAMEFVEGDDLRAWAAKRPVSAPLRMDDRMHRAHALLLQAGRGLAAAHAADLIHRDFKPSNILVGLDGRARVADFGLARAASCTQREPTQPSTVVPNSQLTGTGLVLGTPRYMAPEQQRDGAADMRSDQFAFCTTAWEILFGVHPWLGDPPNEKRPTAPEGAPSRLVGPLLRGLHPDPTARFSAMEDLLAELEPRHARQDRLRLVAVGGLLVLGASVGWSTLAGDDPPCDGLRSELEGAWGAERKQALRSAVLSSGVPYADTALTRLEQTIDHYAEQWTDLRTQTCVATQSVAPSPTAPATLACLAQRRRALGAFVNVVAEGTPGAIGNAVLNAEQLPDVTLCGEADFVLHGFETPQGESAAEIEAIQQDVARSAALRSAGEFARALEVVSIHAARVESLAFPPLSQDYAFERAQVAGALEELDIESELLLAAYAEAARSNRTSLAVDAASQLAVALAVRGDIDGGRRWLTVAEAGQRGNGDEMLQARLLNRRGDVLLSEGDAEAAVVAYAASVAALERWVGADGVELVAPLRDLGAARLQAGHYDDAKTTLARALVLAQQLGAQHPLVADVLHTQIALALALDESAQMFALAEEELAIYRASFGDHHPQTAVGLVSLGAATERLGRAEEALVLLEQADAIYAAAGPGHRLDRTHALSAIAGTLMALGRRDEAAEHEERALNILREVLPPSHPRVAAGVYNLSWARTRQGRTEEGLSLQREARDLMVRSLGPDHPDLATVLGGLGSSLVDLSRYAEAKVEFTRQLEVVEASFGDAHPIRAQPLYNLGLCAESVEDHEAAAAFYTRSVAALELGDTPDDPALSYPLIGLARVLIATGRPAAAVPVAERALGLLAQGDMKLRADARAALARALWLAGTTRPRARELADAAIAEYQTVGAEAEAQREQLETWRATHGL